MLNITEVRVHLLPTSTTNLRGYASITIDDCFVLHGLRILDGTGGVFVAMPRRKRPGAPSQDIAHPLDTETRKHIENKVLDEYAAETSGNSAEASGNAAEPERKGFFSRLTG